MSDTATAEPINLSLDLPVDTIRKEVVPVPAEEIKPDPTLDPRLDRLATEFVQRVLAIDPSAVAEQRKQRQAVDSMGLALQRQAAHRSGMLKGPIKDLAARGADGGDVANALVSLKLQAEELNPNGLNFSVSGFGRLVSTIPGVGTPLQRYFLRYESAQGLIDEIIKSLQAGKSTLGRDNETLADDQDAMRILTRSLEEQIKFAMAVGVKLDAATTALPNGEQKRFILDEIRFPLSQRILDIQQQLAVNQQGVLTIEIVIRNNRELMRGVDRAINVTVSALNVAIAVAMALNNQRIVLDKITALNITTDKLIAGTAERLHTQGVKIHNMASTTMLDMAALEGAFTHIYAAMDEISAYRQAALPKMAEQILHLDQLTDRGERTIQAMERGNRQGPIIDGKLAD